LTGGGRRGGLKFCENLLISFKLFHSYFASTKVSLLIIFHSATMKTGTFVKIIKGTYEGDVGAVIGSTKKMVQVKVWSTGQVVRILKTSVRKAEKPVEEENNENLPVDDSKVDVHLVVADGGTFQGWTPVAVEAKLNELQFFRVIKAIILPTGGSALIKFQDAKVARRLVNRSETIQLGENLRVTAAFLQETDPLLASFSTKKSASATRTTTSRNPGLEAVPTPPGSRAERWKNAENARAPKRTRHF
jgi:hypothetical protein